MPNKKPQNGINQTRTVDLAVKEVKDEERRVTVSFSSEQSYERWFGSEILQHDEGSLSLERLQNIGIALYNHKSDYVIGKLENIKLDAEAKRAYADIVFDDDEESEKIYKKVKSGTLKGVSVGYRVDVWEDVAAGKSSSNGRFAGPAYIATKWTPFEVSIVSVPADDSVGVNRNQENSDINGEKDNEKGENQMPNEKPQVEQKAVDVEAEKKLAIAAERQRVSEITTLCKSFNLEAKSYVDEGKSVEEVRAAVLKVLEEKNKAVPASKADVEVKSDESDKIRNAASDAILLRSGIQVEKPAEGYQDFRGMSLERLAMFCAERDGQKDLLKMSKEELFRNALSPTSQFPNIVADSMSKVTATSYKAANTTFEAWAGKGSSSDFKPTKIVQISEAGDLEEIKENGEFKFDAMKDNGVNIQLKTYGKKFGFSRQLMINDDLGQLLKAVQAYVRAGKRGINKLVYQIVGGNSVIYTGNTLFHNTHDNQASSGAAMSVATISAGKAAMRKQKNLRSKETLNISPAFLLVPAELEATALQLLNSIADPASSNANVKNVIANTMQLVVDAELDGHSTAAYYMAASPSDIDTILVHYLNGNESPIVEMQNSFDTLGMEFRIYQDVGVSCADYRGLYKNAGASEST